MRIFIHLPVNVKRAFDLLRFPSQEAPMSRVEPKEHPKPAPREAKPGRTPAPTPGKAEGDERAADEALQRQDRK